MAYKFLYLYAILYFIGFFISRNKRFFRKKCFFSDKTFHNFFLGGFYQSNRNRRKLYLDAAFSGLPT